MTDRSEYYEQVQESKNKVNNEIVRGEAERTGAVAVLRVTVVAASYGVQV